MPIVLENSEKGAKFPFCFRRSDQVAMPQKIDLYLCFLSSPNVLFSSQSEIANIP
jgi:hypothetical protein